MREWLTHAFTVGNLTLLSEDRDSLFHQIHQLIISPSNKGRSEKLLGRTVLSVAASWWAFLSRVMVTSPAWLGLSGEPPSRAARSLELGTMRSQGRHPNRSSMEAIDSLRHSNHKPLSRAHTVTHLPIHHRFTASLPDILVAYTRALVQFFLVHTHTLM